MSCIPYVHYSKYMDSCRVFVRRHAAVIDSGKKIKWTTGWTGGYYGSHVVMISQGTTFCTTYQGSDPSRFPLRLRALATALRDVGLNHLFHLVHKGGVIWIQRLNHVGKPPVSGAFANTSGTGRGGAGVIAAGVVTIPGVSKADSWWRELQKVIEDARRSGLPVDKLVFPGGGNIPIPDWFTDWCKKNGIEIEILEPGEMEVGPMNMEANNEH